MFMFTKKLYVLIYHMEFNLFQSIFSKKLIPFMKKFDMFYFSNITTWLESMIESPTFYPRDNYLQFDMFYSLNMEKINEWLKI